MRTRQQRVPTDLLTLLLNFYTFTLSNYLNYYSVHLLLYYFVDQNQDKTTISPRLVFSLFFYRSRGIYLEYTPTMILSGKELAQEMKMQLMERRKQLF